MKIYRNNILLFLVVWEENIRFRLYSFSGILRDLDI